MSESKMRKEEIDAKIDAMKSRVSAQTSENARATAHMAEMGSVPATFVNHISGCMTVDGLFRISAGEIIHQSVPGKFHFAMNMPVHVLRAFGDMTGTLLKQYDEMIAKNGAPKPPEATIKSDTFDNTPHQVIDDKAPDIDEPGRDTE